jgi:very-short-patch-repair endonuclease
MGGLPDPDWYLDNVLLDAGPASLLPEVAPRPSDLDTTPSLLWRRWWEIQAESLAGDAARELASQRGFVVGAKALRQLGWQRHDIRRELRRGRWTVAARGVFSPVVVEGDEHDARRKRHALSSSAAALLHPGRAVSGRSAAILHGLPTFGIPGQPILTTQGNDPDGRRHGAHVRSASLDAHALTAWYGASLLTVARTLVDLARLDRRDAIMAADAALRAELVTLAEIETELVGAAGWPGIRQARSVLSLADGRAESPLESLVRLALHDDGFPPPEPQLVVGGYRVDFCWPEYRLIVEADGRGKYTDDALWEEKKRETRLRALGYRVERVLWADVVTSWPVTSRRLQGYFVR